MQVDTSEFAALRDQVDGLAAELAEVRRALPLREFFIEEVGRAGFRAGRDSVLGRKQGPRRRRPGYLRSVDGGAS
jgi:hypothetical protein